MERSAVEIFKVEDLGTHEMVSMRVHPDRIPSTWRSIFARLVVRE